MTASGLSPSIMVDCSHGNAGKKFELQEKVWNAVLRHRCKGNASIVGMLLESNLVEGAQAMTEKPSDLRYGVSITDECVSWETTKRILRSAATALKIKRKRA
jgi:3-deoxy-7-phosphoheptulonate synthase